MKGAVKFAIVGLVAGALGFAWGAAVFRYHVFPHALLASAVEYKDPRVEARRDYLAAKAGPAETVFVGDSIFAAVEWAEEFPGAVNRGISGDTTADVLDRIESLVRLNAPTYVIQLGTNDLGHGVAPEQAAQNMQRIVDALPGRNVIMSVTPCNPSFGDCAPREIDRLNELLAATRGAEFVSSHLDPATDLADKVHPNARGIFELVGAICPHVRDHSAEHRTCPARPSN